jgi:hypothetical protein
MKRIITISILAAAIFIGASILYAQAARTSNGPVGAFQLLAGRYNMGGLIGPEAETEQTTIFRIDTRTGKTWVYMTGKDKSEKFYQGWGEVPEGITYGK